MLQSTTAIQETSNVLPFSTSSCGIEQAQKLLLVEDSSFFRTVVTRAFSSGLPNVEVISAASLAEAQEILEERGSEFFIALLDLNLPDAPDGEVVDYVLEKGLPTVVFTGQYDEEYRERLLEKNVLDYVIKDSPSSLDYVVSMVGRIQRNKTTRVLVVDDSRTFRKYTSDLLRIHQFEVVEADCGNAALERLHADQSIKLLITDHHMPGMSGFELINAVRRIRPRHELAIIGLSGSGSASLSAKFIKYGANDFINKPFPREEFFCRVSQNVDLLESIEALRDAANKDFLTKIPNRRHFFELGERLMARAKRDQLKVVVANMDIDFFKKINDTYGHDAGDIVLKGIAQIIEEKLRRPTDIVARVGGEEFAFFADGMNISEAETFFDELRVRIELATFDTAEGPLNVTASFGLVVSDPDNLSSLLTRADGKLDEAKAQGRNRVVAMEV